MLSMMGSVVFASQNKVTENSFMLIYDKFMDKDDSEKLITNAKVFYNPISTQISASFKLNKQSVVVVKVMDALGSEVLNLMNDTLDEGVQNLTFDTNEKLTPGFYFVRLTAGNDTIVKRISIR